MKHRLSSTLGRTVAVGLLSISGTACLHAQQQESTIATLVEPASLMFTDPGTGSSLPSLDLKDDGVAYSSSVGANALNAAENYVAGEAEGGQPAPRRRYGRPNYTDSAHNADGSNKYVFLAGVGLALPVGDTHAYYTPSYGLEVGAGRNFNKKVGVLLQFDYDHLGLQANTLNNQQYLYNYGCTAANGCTPVTGLDGNAHVWSFTLDPTYTFYNSDTAGAYVVVGAGFYHKVTNFTLPETACADYYCEFQYEVNENVDHYTSNAVGFNGGFGMTYKVSRFANERFFAEARYVFVPNSQRIGVTAANVGTFGQTYTGYNDFPANSNRTSYIPIKFGLRF